jgi:hypothetical protein
VLERESNCDSKFRFRLLTVNLIIFDQCVMDIDMALECFIPVIN